MTECKKCGKCCTSYPCALLPDDVKPIAELLRVTEQELFKKYLVLDYWCDEDRGDLFYLCPARQSDEPGQIVSFSWAFKKHPCGFLTEDNLYQIHTVKPHGGRTVSCKTSDAAKNKKWYADQWVGKIKLYFKE